MAKSKKSSSNDPMLEKLIEAIYQRTCDWSNKYGFNKKNDKSDKQGKYSEKASKLANLLDNHSFGGHDSAVREAFEIAINEKLPPLKSKDKYAVSITYEIGIVVVPLTDPNSHGYTLGEPILIIKSEGRGATPNTTGITGKVLPTSSLTAIRPATKNEIAQLLEDLMKNNDKCFNIVLASFFLENIK